MSRALTSGMYRIINAEDSDEAIIRLLTLDHEDLSDPIRVAMFNEHVHSRGNTFLKYPYHIVYPDDNDRAAPKGRLQIGNVDRSIVTTLRNTTNVLNVTMEIVRENDPETVEVTFNDFKLRNVTYDAQFVAGDLVIENFSIEPYPQHNYTPFKFPGLF